MRLNTRVYFEDDELKNDLLSYMEYNYKVDTTIEGGKYKVKDTAKRKMRLK